MRVSSLGLLPCLECLNLSEQSKWDDTEDPMDIELLSLSKPWSGRGIETWVTVVAVLSVSYYVLSLRKTIEGSIYHQNLHEQTYLLVGKFLEAVNLKGCGASGLTQGCPGPLSFTL